MSAITSGAHVGETGEGVAGSITEKHRPTHRWSHFLYSVPQRLLCSESERMLREESESDSSLRAQHGAKWSRTSSDKLTGTFTANATKYRTIINNATQADSMVKEKLTTHMAGMQVRKWFV